MTIVRSVGLLIVFMVSTLIITACGTATTPSGAITINDAWVRVASEGNTAAYMQIRNTTDSTITLTGVEVDFAGMAEVHETVIDDDIARMRELTDGLAIPAGDTATLAPGGVHLMLMNVQSALSEGDTAELTLQFADGTTIPVTAEIRQSPPQDD